MKKLFLIVLVLISSTVLFAESAAVGITDSDVLNFINNYSLIQKSVNSITTEKQLDDLLSDYGISGDNRIEKYPVLLQGMAVITAESKLDPDTLAKLEMLGANPISNLMDKINSKDLTVMRKYSKQLIALSNGEDTEYAAVTTSRTRKNSSLLSEATRNQLLAQQQEAFRQQEQEKVYINDSKKKKPLEGSKYLSTVEKMIKNSKKTSDCEFLYKKYDSKNAFYYKKETSKIPSFSVHKAWYVTSEKTEQEALFSISSSGITLRYINDEGEEIENKIRFKLTSSELYIPKKNGKEKYYDKGVGGEIILKTEEAGTVHIWYNEGQYSSNQNVKVWIEALGEVDFDEIVYLRG